MCDIEFAPIRPPVADVYGLGETPIHMALEFSCNNHSITLLRREFVPHTRYVLEYPAGHHVLSFAKVPVPPVQSARPLRHTPNVAGRERLRHLRSFSGTICSILERPRESRRCGRGGVVEGSADAARTSDDGWGARKGAGVRGATPAAPLRSSPPAPLF